MSEEGVDPIVLKLESFRSEKDKSSVYRAGVQCISRGSVWRRLLKLPLTWTFDDQA